MKEPTYRFICHIVDEDTDEVLHEGSTYIIPTSISQFGECESVDMEVAKTLRAFKKQQDKLPDLSDLVKMNNELVTDKMVDDMNLILNSQ